MYVQDHDEILPTWNYRTSTGHVIWTEFMRPYFRDLRILDQGFTTPADRTASSSLAGGLAT